jgi:hypothetical protein
MSVLTDIPDRIQYTSENVMEESTLFDSEGSNFQITNKNFHRETYISGERLNDKETKTIDSKKQRKKGKLLQLENYNFYLPVKKLVDRLSSDQRSTIFDYFKRLNFGQKQLFLHKYIGGPDITRQKKSSNRRR